ncbi:hypothetical protein [Nonomuraea angiospora]|uniref:hypothetical protein n=1 Tax=Nonomuraea angiospora TaxID=46172 RepID=UPI0029BCE049|nr:hypothetical protein [Nonomuraea angiospora]MDX3099277.1 hypothetical protein [Nonomuraea angiospora]
MTPSPVRRSTPTGRPASVGGLGDRCRGRRAAVAYLTAHISRFGLCATDVLRLRPDDFDPDLPEIDFTTLTEAA